MSRNVPQDVEAERSLLATCCAPGAEPLAAEVVGHLQEEDFIHPAHRAVFAALRSLLDQQLEVNALTLKAELEKAGNLGKVSGISGLSEILDKMEVGRPMVLAGLLRDLRLRRDAMKAADRAHRVASDLGIPIADVQDAFQQAAESLLGSSRTSDPLTVVDTASWASTEPPPPRFLVDGLLPLGVPAILAGKPNCGKSMLALELMFAVATGRQFLGRRGQPAPMGTLYVGMEDGPDELHRRWTRCLQLSREDPTWSATDEDSLLQHWRTAVPDWSSAGSKTLPALVPQLLKVIQSMPSCGLIVLDTLAALSDGPENNAETSLPFQAAVNALMTPSGATVLVLHHNRKEGGGARKTAPPTLADRFNPDNIRGSSALVGFVRAIVMAEPLTPEEAARVSLDEDRAGAGNYLALALVKNNGGPKGQWLALEQREAGESGAGFFVPMPGGDRVLAALRSKAAVAGLNKAEEALLAVAERLDHGALANRLYPGDPRANDKVKALLNKLRTRHQWLQKGSLDLTVTGYVRVRELKGGQVENPVHREEVESDDLLESA